MTNQRIIRSAILIALLGVMAFAQTPAGNVFKTYPVQGNIWLIPEPEANVLVSLGRDGVMLVDTGTAANANKLLPTVRQLADDVLARPMPFPPCVGPSCAAYRYPYGDASPSFDGITAAVAPHKPTRTLPTTPT